MTKKILIMLVFSAFFVCYLSAQINSGPTKFENTDAAISATLFNSTQEIVDFSNDGKFIIGKYYIVRGSIQNYSGSNYQLNVGTINKDSNQISLNVIYNSRPPEWTNQFNNIVALLLYREDKRLYVIEMIRNFQVRTDDPRYGFLKQRPSTLQDWLTGITDERGVGQDIFDFQRNDTGMTITKYNKTDRTVIIPREIDGIQVTIIGKNTFKNRNIDSITIPNSVTVIEDFAFQQSSLQSIIIPESVTIIGENAFASNNLTTINIPMSVSIISNSAFRSNKLTDISISSNVKTIEQYAFEGNKITVLSIPQSVIKIGRGAFSNNKLTSLIIPNSLTIIEDAAFENNNLTNISIPEGITKIERNAFRNNKLTNIVIPKTVNEIGGTAFVNMEITTISIGENVKLGTKSFGREGSQYNDTFGSIYSRMTRRAGIYTYDGKDWNYKMEIR